MAASERKIQPIIVKRVRKVARGGHHGGAWKIAYADFVTAMMAFFLLMWLLGSTTKGDLEGIADYFRTPLQVALSGGSGSGDSSSLVQGGGTDLTRTIGAERRGDIEARQKKINLQALRAELRRVEQQRLTRLKAQIEAAIASNPRLSEVRSQIRLDMTPDGLRIQIVDAQNRPMFDLGSPVVKDYMRELLHEIAGVLNSVDHRLSLSGHTDAAPYSGGERGYSNWELSADRANATRRELVAGGLNESKVVRVLGLGPSVMYDLDNPRNPMNRRIMIVVLNHEAEARVYRGSEVDASDATRVEDALGQASGAGAAGEPAQGNGQDAN
ncbi:MAG: flagellar motor protein MotB [Burkholderiaceae bacterium]|nr:flagellar motor protein MotB [Burkholderiaceae bacterium]